MNSPIHLISIEAVVNSVAWKNWCHINIFLAMTSWHKQFTLSLLSSVIYYSLTVYKVYLRHIWNKFLWSQFKNAKSRSDRLFETDGFKESSIWEVKPMNTKSIFLPEESVSILKMHDFDTADTWIQHRINNNVRLKVSLNGFFKKQYLLTFASLTVCIQL